MKKHNIISDWLDKYGDPVIDEKVEKEIKRINNMKQTAVEWLVGEVELISNSTGVSKEERIELYNNAIEKAKQMEYDNTRRIAYTAYNYGQLDDPTEGKFNKFFSESFKSE